MTSSEKILAGITDQANKKADEIIAEAEKTALTIISSAEADARIECETITHNAKQKADLLISTGNSSAALLKRDMALSCKRESIQNILTEVIKEIKSYNDKEYFAYIFRLIKKSVLPQKGILLLSAEDLKRDINELSENILQLNLTLSKTPAEIDGGFILKYDDIEINGELKAIIHEKRELLVDTINSVVFNN